MNTTIGILGGMGPRATVEFEARLVDRFDGSDQNIPTIITINDGSIPDRSMYLQGRGADPLPQLLQRALDLQLLGVDIIALPCNTACAPQIYDRLTAFLVTPVINLPQITADFIADNAINNVALLGTSGTIKSQNFQARLSDKAVDFIVPNKETQRVVDKLIRSIKTAEPDPASLNLVRQFLINSDAEAAILGCTELPMVKNALLPTGVAGIDTIDILVGACVEYTKEKGELKCYQTNTLLPSQC